MLMKITHEEFCNLKPGDTVWIRCGGRMYKSEVVRAPFYNVDADEPGWEVETDNGFCDEYSLYI